jgi:hypothetical protein
MIILLGHERAEAIALPKVGHSRGPEGSPKGGGSLRFGVMEAQPPDIGHKHFTFHTHNKNRAIRALTLPAGLNRIGSCQAPAAANGFV